MIKKKKDDEIYFVAGMVIFFGAALLCVDFFYSDWPGMTNTWLSCGLAGAILLHLGAVAAAYISLREWRDYGFDVFRKWFCAFAFAAILYVGGFRAARNERGSVIDDSNNAKQEQIK